MQNAEDLSSSFTQPLCSIWYYDQTPLPYSSPQGRKLQHNLQLSVISYYFWPLHGPLFKYLYFCFFFLFHFLPHGTHLCGRITLVASNTVSMLVPNACLSSVHPQASGHINNFFTRHVNPKCQKWTAQSLFLLLDVLSR